MGKFQPKGRVFMRYYFAPMEGLTDCIYRRIHQAHFPGLDAYYMPFISPTQHRCLTHREARDLPMVDTVPFRAVPQIMTKIPEDFIWAAQQVADRGYDEVNLNVGCPSGTVVSKGKGSGMLADPDHLDRFLDAICAGSPIPVSVKTRLGVNEPEEFPRLMEIFNQYPIKELTIHPRVRKQFYKGDVYMEFFRYALENSRVPLCYNGNLRTASEVEAFEKEFPMVESLMIGRGLVGNPAMLCPENFTADKIRAFHDELLDEYIVAFGGARNAIFRLKESWHHMICLFEDSEKLWKKLRKCTDIVEFKSITDQIFDTLTLAPELQADW